MSASPDPDAFRVAFADVRPLILDEWPTVDVDALDATEGALDEVVVLVAERSGRTKALTRRLLAELLTVVAAPAEPATPPSRGGRDLATRAESRAHSHADRDDSRDGSRTSEVAEPVESIVASLESHLEALTREVKRDVTPLATETAREHLGLVLFLTAGVAFAAGLFLGALGYPHEAPSDEETSDDDT